MLWEKKILKRQKMPSSKIRVSRKAVQAQGHTEYTAGPSCLFICLTILDHFLSDLGAELSVESTDTFHINITQFPNSEQSRFSSPGYGIGNVLFRPSVWMVE